MKTIKKIFENTQQKLWCECFLGFKYIAYKMEWDQNVPNDIEIFNSQTIVKQLLGGK